MEAFAASDEAAAIGAVYSSGEQKAKDGAAILGSRLGLSPTVKPTLHENDRSATGFLPPDEFWPVVEQFFANPETPIRGWERAIDAQRRIVSAVEEIQTIEEAKGDIAIVAHGGVGALFLAHLTGTTISRALEQPHGGGGCYLTIDRQTGRLVTGWKIIR